MEEDNIWIRWSRARFAFAEGCRIESRCQISFNSRFNRTSDDQSHECHKGDSFLKRPYLITAVTVTVTNMSIRGS